MRDTRTSSRRKALRPIAALSAAAITAMGLVALPGVAVAAPTPDDTAPAATTTDVTISARVAFQRAPVADFDNPAFLEGVTFELYVPAGPGDDAAPGTPTGYSCTIPAGALDCTIEVPDTGDGGQNEGRRFAVVTTDAGSSAYAIDSVMTGTSSAPVNQRFYPGLTPPLLAGQPVAFPPQGAGETLNSGVVALGLDNPAVLPVCGPGRDPLELAVLFDLSGSVNEQQRFQYRAAFSNLVEELEGLPIALTLSTFGTSSPVAGRESGPWSLEDAADVDALLDRIEAYTEAVPGPTQQTNWDQALRRVADTAGAFDMLLMLTDGAPNYVSDASGTGGQPTVGSAVTVASIEQAVFSANAVKAEGTRVVAVGIGNGATGDAARNLSAISGPTPDSDYFQSAWETLTEDVRAAADVIACSLPITVTKHTVDTAGGDPVPTDGWSFTLETSDVSEGTATVVGETPQVTGSGDNPTGQASWTVNYSTRGATTTIAVSEIPQDGYRLVDASYTVSHQDGTVTTGTGTSPSLTIPGLQSTDRVDVAFTNAPVEASFQIRKVIAGEAAASVPDDTTFAVDYAVNGVAADQPLQITADGALTTGPALSVGDEVTFTEQEPPAIAGVTWGAAPSVEPIVLGEEPVVVDVRNTATFSAATFQVRKSITGEAADAVPSDTAFTLDYTVNGIAALQPLVVRADGALVDGPTLTHGDLVVITERTPPSVGGVVWGPTPASQTITLDASGVTVVEVTNVADPSAAPAGTLPITGGDVAIWAAMLGGGLLVAGAALAVMARHRRRELTLS